MITNQTLAAMFRTWANDYLTIAKFAEDHGISEHDARALINMGRVYHNQMATAKLAID